jgi:hypothetical protein
MLLAAPPLPVSALAEPPPRPYAAPAPALARAQLGRTLDAWRASSAGAGAQCDAGAAPGVVTCRLPSAPLGGGYRARTLAYRFQDGRLARITWEASIDALPFATAVLKHDWGEPRITRDTIAMADGSPLQHVSMRWRSGAERASLSDPTRSAGRLQVRLDADAAAGASGGAAPTRDAARAS